MKMVKCLLLGSAAGFATMGGAYAADLPVKAKPVEYVKVCSLYGAGFWYVPGTDTCIKLGGYIRAQFGWNEGNGGQPAGQGDFSETTSGLMTRTDTTNMDMRYRGVMSVDMRTQTEYGTLRSYMDLGTQQTSLNHFGGGSSGISALGSPGNSGGAGAANNNYFNETVDVSRAFIQFAGLTAGRIRSFFDINSLGPYSLFNARVSNDTAAGGMVGIAYTFQLGNGISLSAALEDGGTLISGRGYYVNNMNQIGTTVGGNGSVWGNIGTGVAADNSVPFALDPVLALRIDQAWGYAGISGALHGDSGGYYGSSQAGSTSPIGNGHPSDTWGWALTSGFTLTNFLGFRGDTFGVQGSYCIGAEGYCSHSQSSSLLVGGNKLTAVWNQDGVYQTGTGVELTTNWAVYGFYEHLWNSKWRTSLWGGVMGAEYDQTAVNMICPAGAGGNGMRWETLTFTAGSTCNPNYNTWEIGSRTMWNPHPDLDIGVEVMYTQLNQSNSGSAVFNPAAVGATGALGPSTYNFANQGIWSAAFRVQRNFLY